jgi:hypothetical protein
MAKDIKEESKLKALAYCGLREIPEKDNGTDFWLRALALVKKNDGTENYVYAERDLNTLEPRLIKDFGAVAMIHTVVEYYPYSYLKEQYMPKFKTQKKEERIKYLTTYDKNADFSEYTLKELDKEVMRRAARKQMDVEKRGEKKH